MGLAWEDGPAGTWLTLRRGNDSVHLIENAGGTRFYTWCDNPAERTVQAFPNPYDAIRAGLKRCSSIPVFLAHSICISLSTLSAITAL
jgi:hypothetical protein